MIVPLAPPNRAGSTRTFPDDVQFVQTVRTILSHFPMLPQHYPGMAERYERFRAAYPQRDEVTSFECPTGAQYRGPPPLPWMLIELDPAGSNDYALQNEAFGPVLAFVYLPGGNRPDAFLREMVTFTHSRLWGALSATLVVRDEVLAEEPAAVEAAIADLRYGIVCLNTWSAMSFELGATTWGGYPGETLDTVASGIGVTGNCMLIRKPEKTVLRAPFQHAAQLKLFPDGTTALSAAQLRAVATFTHVPSSWNLTKLIFRMVTGSKPKPPTVASPSHTPTVAGSPSPSPPPPSPVCGTAFGVGSTSPATPRRGVLRSRGAYMGFFAPRFFVLDGHELRWWGKGRVIGVVASRAEPTPDGPPRGLMRLTGARVTGTEGPTGSKGGERCILIVPAADVAARGEPSSLPAAERTFTMVLAAPSEVEHVSWLRELQRAAAGA